MKRVDEEKASAELSTRTERAYQPDSLTNLDCPMCGAQKAFTINAQNEAKGYCAVEGLTYTIRPGVAMDKCACGHARLNHTAHAPIEATGQVPNYCGYPGCECDEFQDKAEHASRVFNSHVKGCGECSEPFNYCSEGASLLRASVDAGN